MYLNMDWNLLKKNILNIITKKLKTSFQVKKVEFCNLRYIGLQGVPGDQPAQVGRDEVTREINTTVQTEETMKQLQQS